MLAKILLLSSALRFFDTHEKIKFPSVVVDWKYDSTDWMSYVFQKSNIILELILNSSMNTVFNLIIAFLNGIIFFLSSSFKLEKNVMYTLTSEWCFSVGLRCHHVFLSVFPNISEFALSNWYYCLCHLFACQWMMVHSLTMHSICFFIELRNLNFLAKQIQFWYPRLRICLLCKMIMLV